MEEVLYSLDRSKTIQSVDIRSVVDEVFSIGSFINSRKAKNEHSSAFLSANSLELFPLRSID